MFSKSVIAATLFATGLAASGTARAADPVGSAILGAGAGALLGHALGGRDGALIGGALGAVAGATAASAQRASHRAYGYGDPGHGYPPGVTHSLPPVVVSPGVAYPVPAYPVPAYPVPPVGYGQPVPGYRGVAPVPGAYRPGYDIARAQWERARFEEQRRARWQWEREQRERLHWEREQPARPYAPYPHQGRDGSRHWQ